MTTGELLQTDRQPNTESAVSGILQEAHGAIAGTSTPIENVAEQYVHEAAQQDPSRLSRWARTSKAVAGAALLAVGMGGAASPAVANTEPTPVKSAADLPPTFTATFKAETHTASIKVSDIAKKRMVVLSNISAKPIPPKQLNRLRSRNLCRVFDGKEVSIRTKGLNVNGQGEYGQDHRESEFCRINGIWIRVKCKNPAKINVKLPPRRNPEKQYIFVKSFVNANVRIRSVSVAEARCPDGSASGRGYASVDQYVRLRTLIKTRGGSVVRLQNDINDQASTRAEADVKCSSSETQVTIVQPGQPQEPTPEQPSNNPPTGRVEPDQHFYSEDTGKICVDNISDPENDPVRAYNFRVYRKDDPALNDNDPNTHPSGIGQIGEVYTQAGGAQCVPFKAPRTETNFKAVATASLTDGKQGGNTNLPFAEFDILADDFGTAQ